MRNQQDGAANRGAMWLVAILVIALIVVFFLWQRDRESKDLEVDIGLTVPGVNDVLQGDVPVTPGFATCEAGTFIVTSEANRHEKEVRSSAVHVRTG
jgi:hypothetical protein